MINDCIPDLPIFNKDELQKGNDLEAIISEILVGQNRFIFYENLHGDLKLFFDGIDSALYCCLVVKLCKPENHKIYEFLKLVLEAVYQEKKLTKKGHEVACKVQSLLKV